MCSNNIRRNVGEINIRASTALTQYACSNDPYGRYYTPLPPGTTWDGFKGYYLLRYPYDLAPCGNKDLQAVICPEMRGRDRGQAHFVCATLFILDIDSGGTMEESQSWLEASGYAGVIVPSISFGKSQSRVKAKAVEKTGLILGDYLIEKKKIIRRLMPSIGGLYHDRGDIVFNHAPLEKHRIYIPLSHPFTGSPAEYQAGYRMAADASGLGYDDACDSVEHMYFLPHRRDENHVLPRPIEVEGNPFDFPVVTIAPKAKSVSSRRAVSQRNGRVSGYGHGHDLRGVELADLIADQGLIDIRRDKLEDGKIEVECPFDEDHSNPGDPNDCGFCVWNSSATESGKYPVASCRHAHCQGRCTEEFVAKMVSDGMLKLPTKIMSLIKKAYANA